MAVIPVAIAGAPYEVRIEAGLLRRLGSEVRPFIRKGSVPVVTDANVAAQWREVVEASLTAAGLASAWLVLPAGEATKSWEHLARVVDFLLEQEIERKDNVIALGGGVIGDLTGFAASMVKRGCGFIQIPTTLLAQVDSSVGGKTAINTALGKNLVGAFHQPSLVLADPDALDTLSLRDTRAGYAEVVKYGLIDDAGFFEWCEQYGPALLKGDPQARETAIAKSVAAKARIVAADEKETAGVRALLNLGHTFGHALEAETGFSDRLLHGEGVALGMVLAARFSARLGLMTGQDAQRVAAHIGAIGLPASLAALGLDCDGRRLADHMLHDKKMDAGTLPFLLMRGIGQTFLAKDVDLSEVAAFLDEELAA
ncbi:3-dehydroquinate synthase [Novosphingobium cyanobacteriorum]|uniref:3-dehydroquinate synthase n=1 Tax=Novosphingobium cyanobacteriorum TaxID=3024215 RepID=A0ABT6CDG3_9SPHN|nr:3-dehydroquinate synthase [Novosphingobium cyanobacteriorum]MDF8331846.1 3-dehydroquinate synthase [Novosphingobium cyanobacteriorum]